MAPTARRTFGPALAAATLTLILAACVDSGIETAAMTHPTSSSRVDGPAPPIRIAAESPPDVVRPRIDPWPLPDDSTLRPAQRRAVEVLVDLSTGSAGEKLAQRSACRVLDGIAEPLYDAPGWQVRIVATVTMQHGRALLSSPQQRSADDSVVVLARLLADTDAVAGHPYRPVFVHGCSPY